MPSLLSRLNGRQARAQSSSGQYGRGISSSDIPRSSSGASQFQDAQQDGLEEVLCDNRSLQRATSSSSEVYPRARSRAVSQSEQSSVPRQRRSHDTLRQASELVPASSRRSSFNENASTTSAVSATPSQQQAGIRQFLTSSNSSRFYNEFGAPRGQGPFFTVPDAETSQGAVVMPGASSSTLSTIPVRRKGSDKKQEIRPTSASEQEESSTRADTTISMPAAATKSLSRGDRPSPQYHARKFKTLPEKPVLEPEGQRQISSPMGKKAAFLPSSPLTVRTQSPRHTDTSPQPPMYGYTPIGWDKQMDMPKVAELVLMCGEQIRSRGLDSPLIFSSMALGLDERRVTQLIEIYLANPREFLANETRFADAHDLAAVVKWALARLGRVYPVPVPDIYRNHKRNESASDDTVFVHQRGFLEVDAYQTWAAQERAGKYPVAAFSSFLDGLPSSTAALLVALLSLLSSTTSYSFKNGMTPSKLGRTFGPLIFGLPEDETFDKTYDNYVRVSNAAEHLLLAYIRDMSATETLPVRLADHIRGYPAMLTTEPLKFPPGVRTMPISIISRNVRLYSVDLIRQAAELDLASVSPEWAACCGKNLSGDPGGSRSNLSSSPQVTDRFRKLINLRLGFEEPSDGQRVSAEQDLETYKSLADKAWGDFMKEGFTAPDKSKLAFDLHESKRKGAHRLTQGPTGWNFFEESGFASRDEGLDSALAFDWNIHEDLRKWPEERAELMSRLHKTNKAMPSFHYDTTPRVVASPSKDGVATGQWHDKPYSKIDDVFPEVYADYLLCNGWSNRDELTHRNANFVVLQYKSRPTASSTSTLEASRSPQKKRVSGSSDNRTDAAWFVIEEIVPSQYRTELEAVGRQKNKSRASLRALSIFRKRKEQNGGGHDSFFDEVFKPNLGTTGSKKVDAQRELAIAELDLERSDSLNSVNRDHSKSDNGHRGTPTKTMTSTSKLLSSLKLRAGKRLGKMKKAEDGDDSTQASPLGKAGGDLTLASGEYDAHSLQDSEIEAFAAPSQQRKSSKLFTMGRAHRNSQDDSWLDVVLKDRSRLTGKDAAPLETDDVKDGNSKEVTDPSSPQPRESAETTRAYDAERESIRFASTGRSPEVQSTSRASAQKTQGHDLSVDFAYRKEILPALPALDGQPPARTRNDDSEMPNVPEKAASPEQASPHSYPPNPSSGRKSTSSNGTNGGISAASPSPRLSSLSPPHPVDAAEPAPASSETRSHISQARVPIASQDVTLGLGDGAQSSIDRERAREERINAAKQRAKELRANLTPVGVSEAERKAAERRKPGSGMYTAKDDPFSKDRVSGRVASITSKFGGSAPRAVSPQSTGGSLSSPGNRLASGSVAAGLPSPLPVTAKSSSNSPQAAAVPYNGRPDVGIDAASNHSKSKWLEASSEVPDLPEKTYMHLGTRNAHENPTDYYEKMPADLYSSTGDTDTIYPEDAASNFSPDTHDEEASPTQARISDNGLPMGSLFSNLHQSPTTAGAAAAAALGGYVPPLLAAGARAGSAEPARADDEGRVEEEDRATDMTPLANQLPRYQPGMPLSNVEEERESLLSGSNV